MRPNLSPTLLLALVLLGAGFLWSGVSGTLALPVRAAGHTQPAVAIDGCAGFRLSGPIADCLTATTVVCNPAGTVDPATGVRVAQDRMRVTAVTTSHGTAELVLSPAATALILSGAIPVTLNGGSPAGFSVAAGVRADQDLSESLSGATVHLKGALACY